MTMEKEALTHKIEDDLAARNRNWDKLTSHLAESTSKHITESGTNENGSYIKFDDGTMLCFNKTTVSLESSDTILMPFPSNFITVQGGGIMGGANTYGGPGYASRRNAFNAAAKGMSNINWVFRPNEANLVDDTIDIHLFAIGRWKQ